MRILLKSEQGASSLIVVIFMSIIMSIVTIGFVRIAVNESRNATDDDLTARAYYAAESGLEDARRAVAENLSGSLSDTQLQADNCDEPAGYDPVLSAPNEFDAEYTCMLIDFTPGQISADFDGANQTKQYEINAVNSAGNSTQFNRLELNWHVNDAVGNGGDGEINSGVNLRGTTDVSIPQVSAWSFPAMMEVTFVSYPNGNFQENDLQIQKGLVSPNDNGTGTVSLGGLDGRVALAECTDGAPGSMACSMEFTGFLSSRNYTIRITSQYRGGSAELSIFNNLNALSFADAQAVVDVTGRAGVAYRRVEAALDLNNIDLLPDFTIQSATDICKDFSFTNVASDFDGQPNTSCTR